MMHIALEGRRCGCVNVAMTFGDVLRQRWRCRNHRHLFTIGIAVDSNVLIYERPGERCATRSRRSTQASRGRWRRHPLPHHDPHRGGRLVLHRHRPGPRFRGDIGIGIIDRLRIHPAGAH
jgi:hypothetical protein